MRGKRAKQIRRAAEKEAAKYHLANLKWWQRLKRWYLGPQTYQRRHEVASVRFMHRFLKQHWKRGQRDGNKT